MKTAIITIAGASSRFNEGVSEQKKCHKAIYYEKDEQNTLLYHLLLKCDYADKIILVLGYKSEDIRRYCDGLTQALKNKIIFVHNDLFADLGSGYSLYLGIEALGEQCQESEEVLFVEGDLDIDDQSFDRVIEAGKSVLTYSYEPIYANKAVVLYKDGNNRYHYGFNRSHGLLQIEEPFSLILNSGQLWKFTDLGKLQRAAEKFLAEDKGESNLGIVRNYVDACNSDDFLLMPLRRWTNCNTRADYQKILSYWEAEK